MNPLKRKTSSVIPITGGFGNQMFQFAFGLYLKEVHGHEITLDTVIGTPRTTGSLPSICRMSITGEKICTSSKKLRQSKFYSRVYGWNLRTGVEDKTSDGIYRCLFKFMSSVLFFIRYRRILSLNVAKGLGYDEKLQEREAGIFIGYFQTSKYAESPRVLRRLQAIECDSNSIEFWAWLRRVEEEKPIMLHLRLTDYLNEENFGIPDMSYYRDAIKFHREKGNNSKIWVFSDDVAMAKSLFSELGSENDVFYFSDTNLEDVEVWLLMRKSSGFIIANSTFSWWAAFLRENHQAVVCYPKPWFAGMKDPESLCPNNWIGIELP